jgi:hypothetical protein
MSADRRKAEIAIPRTDVGSERRPSQCTESGEVFVIANGFDIALSCANVARRAASSGFLLAASRPRQTPAGGEFPRKDIKISAQPFIWFIHLWSSAQGHSKKVTTWTVQNVAEISRQNAFA